MEKSADAFRTISEVAEIVDVPQHVLRFWETRFSQVRPMKRGGGRRYYRPGDIDLLRGIKRLLYAEGYTIKGVQKLIKDNGIAFVGAVGRGDLAVAEQIVYARQKEQAQTYELFPEDVLPDPKNKEVRGKSPKFFSFLKHDEGKAVLARKPALSKDSATLLQEVLFELIECKRLLDRARS